MGAQTPASRRFESIVLKTLGKICKRLNRLEEQVDVLEDFEEIASRLKHNQIERARQVAKPVGRASDADHLHVNIAGRSENSHDDPPQAVVESQVLIVTNHADGDAEAKAVTNVLDKELVNQDEINLVEQKRTSVPGSHDKLSVLIDGLQ